MPILSSFEILAENLVPEVIHLPPAINPFAIQGYWVQITLPAGGSSQLFNLIFDETTDFNQGAGHSALQAQFIDAAGNVNIYKDFFGSSGRGFLGQQIFAGQTIIYGVQAFPPPSAAQASDPQAGTGWRGTVRIEGQQSGSLIATPTQRLVYFDTSNLTQAKVVDAVVYSLPTASGGTMI